MTPALLPAIEIETRPRPDAAVIWLHGLGADGNDFVPLAEELRLPESAAVRFVFPHAPMRAVTINNGCVMRAWYDIAGADLDRRADEAGVRESQALVEALLARERERGVAASRTVLAGFSQGGVIALHTGLRHGERLAGVLALSCYLALPHALAREARAANRDAPIFMAHGVADPVVPHALGERARAALEAAGYAVEWHGYRMEHAVCWDEIRDIGEWLRRVLHLG